MMPVNRHAPDRRRFLRLAVALVACGSTSTVTAQESAPPTVGLALGSGGASGLAHVLMLEVLDELGVRPAHITGSSIGALIGALYAAGYSGRAIRERLGRILATGPEDGFALDPDAFRWLELLDPEIGHGGLVDSRRILDFFYGELESRRFEDLAIPLTVVAADFWQREPVVLDAGPLVPALQASMALPGVFEPVDYRGRILVDGGTVNPLPYDLLEDCDLTIAVNVLGVRTPGDSRIPGYFENLFNTAKILQQSIIREKLARKRPDILVQPAVTDIRALEFHRADEVFAQSRPAAARLRRNLAALLGR